MLFGIQASIPFELTLRLGGSEGYRQGPKLAARARVQRVVQPKRSVMLRLRLWRVAQRAQTPCRLHTTTSVDANDTSVSSPLPSVKWTPNAIRTGVLARKRGMTVMWDNHGMRVPVTVFQAILFDYSVRATNLYIV